MILNKILFIVLVSLSCFSNLKGQNTDTTAKIIVMRVVESDFLGIASKIYIYEKGEIEKLDLKGFLDAKKELPNNLKIISEKIDAILSKGYKIVSSTCGSGTADTMNSFLITTYIFEKK